jgi:putative MATE family efflux protein
MTLADTIGKPRANLRAQLLLNGPIVSTLFRLSWPNIIVMLAQTSTGLVETWWISHLGTDALAGMAVVFPVVMLMQMMSQGAMGGGISSAIARALGAGRRSEADAFVLHSILINVVFGAFFSIAVLVFGPPLYRALGGQGRSLDAALKYSNVVFWGVVLLWIMNGLASVLRGTGNMLVPALVICGGVVVLVPLSPLLIFGLGPFPALGVAGGGAALLLYYAAGVGVFAWYILSGHNGVSFRWVKPQWPLFREILQVGALAAITSLQTNLTIALTTSLVGNWFGPADVAGYGTGARLEYLLSPVAFGIGGNAVVMVGMNIKEHGRALRIAFLGGGAAFLLSETIGEAAAIGLSMAAVVRLIKYAGHRQRICGRSAPSATFYGLGFALYFAHRSRLTAVAAACRHAQATDSTGGGWFARKDGCSQLFAALALSGWFTAL